jgi:hypothetical protein
LRINKSPRKFNKKSKSKKNIIENNYNDYNKFNDNYNYNFDNKFYENTLEEFYNDEKDDRKENVYLKKSNVLEFSLNLSVLIIIILFLLF